MRNARIDCHGAIIDSSKKLPSHLEIPKLALPDLGVKSFAAE